ncbi:restriction endonuclease [Clostridium sp. 'deep sea']|uniref:restriction endonuclease n=1 Tax=Clostridium sp. 'deep sea' TaxID=2779445 RepID=UPI0018968288|nr:restriction endonuclease [Clostridium sp. 'deep sea']QOR36003.1 restriction endonuclease [Clostridium sp. 'deep sea']
MSNFIRVENSKEFYKNNSIKAYKSLIHHTELDKTLEVRHRDYKIYIQKFNKAVEQLNNEWFVEVKNYKNKTFYENAKIVHTLISNEKPFYYNLFAVKKIICEIGHTPKKPNYFILPKLLQKPLKSNQKYIFEAKWHHKLLGVSKERQKKLDKLFEEDTQRYNEKLNYYKEISEANNEINRSYIEILESYIKSRKLLAKKYDKIHSKYIEQHSKEAIKDYFMLTLNNSSTLNKLFNKIEFDIDIDTDDKVAIVSFEFPQENTFPIEREYKYIKTKKEIRKVCFKDKELYSMIKDIYYSLYIAIALEILRIDTQFYIKDLVLNGYYNGVDKRKGTKFNVCIMTSKIRISEFKEINFEYINPRETFKHFSGKGIPDINNITRVEPLRFTNKSQFKLIDSDPILAHLSADTNLAAMDWRDFEVLIRDVFELEFKEQNIEINNTQCSNDGGVDVVAFNSNPYSGGTILLQAKRYTNIVTPEPVRALKGSMDDHNAIRGILITTSKFGESSREYASKHNITLIDGNKLLDLLHKHGYSYHIDLKQAKLLNAK